MKNTKTVVPGAMCVENMQGDWRRCVNITSEEVDTAVSVIEKLRDGQARVIDFRDALKDIHNTKILVPEHPTFINSDILYIDNNIKFIRST